MRYFTNNPLERLMMQVPKPMREEPPPAQVKGKQVKDPKANYVPTNKKEDAPCAL